MITNPTKSCATDVYSRMTGRAAITFTVLMLSFGCAGMAIAPQLTEKPAMLKALADLRNDIRKLSSLPLSRETKPRVDSSLQSVSWFEREAMEWKPRNPIEGRGLRESFERMGGMVRTIRGDVSKAQQLLLYLDDDLKDKREFCRIQGLGARRPVSVVTKRNGVQEVQGLEVLYLEKFLELDPSARPQQFARFSSPAVDDLVPGRYVFWAKQAGSGGRVGPRKEARITRIAEGSAAEKAGLKVDDIITHFDDKKIEVKRYTL